MDHSLHPHSVTVQSVTLATTSSTKHSMASKHRLRANLLM